MYQSRKKRGGDIDARLKAMYDALEGVMYINDDQIIEQHTYKRWDKENPRVELICYEI